MEKKAERTTKGTQMATTEPLNDIVNVTMAERIKSESETQMAVQLGLDIHMVSTGTDTNQGLRLSAEKSPSKAESSNSFPPRRSYTPTRPTIASQASLGRVPSGLTAFEYYNNRGKEGEHAQKPQSESDVERQAQGRGGSSQTTTANLFINSENPTTGDQIEARLRSWCAMRSETRGKSTRRQD